MSSGDAKMTNIPDTMNFFPGAKKASLARLPRRKKGYFVQQDGATPHFHGKARRYLNTRSPNRWEGPDVPIPWPLQFPDLTPPGISYGDLLWTECKFHLYL